MEGQPKQRAVPSGWSPPGERLAGPSLDARRGEPLREAESYHGRAESRCERERAANGGGEPSREGERQ